MDEAGDLGFSPYSSKTYVIGYVIANATPFEVRTRSCRLLRSINKQLKPRSKISEFKFSNNTHDTRMKFLNLIKSSDLDLGIMAIAKDSISSEDLKENPNILYNYLTVHYVMPVIIRNYLKSTMPVNRIKFKIDQSLSKLGRRKFDDYFDQKLAFVKRQEGFKNDIFAEIEHENSHNDICLQIADYVASSFYRKTERFDSQYYDVIKDKIKYHEKWDWHDKICW
jgi:hypothetical protein